MSSRDFLLEIGLEEVPARFIPQSIEQLKEKVTAWLTDQRISYADVTTYATPRRLTLWIKQMAEKQEDQVEEAKGPAKKIALDEQGNWTKAAQGFARGQGASTDDLYFKELNGVEYVYVTKETKGVETRQILSSLDTVIQSMTFPKNMRWGKQELKFVRPIRWLLALYGEEVIPFSVTGIETGNETYGHRFLGTKVTVNRPEDYERLLLGQYVLANAEERKQAIINQLKEIEAHKNWVIPIDEDLLEEVTYLVEYPTALFGDFDADYLTIPQEVLITSMKEHQRYFPVRDRAGQLLPFFVTIRNGGVDANGTVIKGNEKVLRARLADARFFYEEDKKLTIPAALAKLEQVVFHEELGTIGDKIRRIKELANVLAMQLGIEKEAAYKINRTAEICKFDLVSQMVYEFPELQGRMGQEYALLAGEDPEVAQGIYEHYMPRFAGDVLPQTLNGALVSVADKLDSIVACFSIGIVPTGSQDPYALRRQATGIVQIMLQEKWAMTLPEMFSIALDTLQERNLLKRSAEDVMNDLEHFFSLRLKNRLQEHGIRYDLIDAVSQSLDSDLTSIFSRADILKEKAEHKTFKAFVDAFTRATNLAQKSDEAAEAIDRSLFEHEVESKLYEVLETAQKQIESFAEQGSWQDVYAQLTKLQTPIENFFEHVMVMAEDQKLRLNRLALLNAVAGLANRFADFSSIVFTSK